MSAIHRQNPLLPGRRVAPLSARLAVWSAVGGMDAGLIGREACSGSPRAALGLSSEGLENDR
jgi:hypothetical protein